MTDGEKLTLLELLSGESDEDTLAAYLAVAGDAVCRRAYPFDETVFIVPDKYAYTQVKAAAYLLDKRGATGEIAHNENGVNRTYESADIPPSLLQGVVPMAGVPK